MQHGFYVKKHILFFTSQEAIESLENDIFNLELRACIKLKGRDREGFWSRTFFPGPAEAMQASEHYHPVLKHLGETSSTRYLKLALKSIFLFFHFCLFQLANNIQLTLLQKHQCGVVMLYHRSHSSCFQVKHAQV